MLGGRLLGIKIAYTRRKRENEKLRKSLAGPTRLNRFKRAGFSLDDRHFLRASLAAFENHLGAPSDSGGILTQFLRCWFPILDLAAGNVDHEFSELGEIARAFAEVIRHRQVDE